MKPRRIILYVILPALILYLGMRFYARYRHINIYVSRVAAMPAELAAGLHMEEHKIDPRVTIESPYDSVEDRKLSLDEIRRLRSQIAWSMGISPFIDSLTIQTPTRVLARRTTSQVVREYQLVKEGDHWVIESEARTEIQTVPTKK
jgi:hypothetical protein